MQSRLAEADIHEFKRCELSTEALRRFTAADVDTLDELARIENKTLGAGLGGHLQRETS
jgi:hypothetical protein